MVALFWLFVCTPSIALPTFRVVTDEERIGGYEVPIAVEILRRLGYRAEIDYMPWARAVSDAKLTSRCEMLLGGEKSPDRAAMLVYSDQIAQDEIDFFALRSRSIHYKNLADLAPYRIGMTRGGVFSDAFLRAHLNLQTVVNIDENIRMLLAGRTDLLIDKKELTLYHLHTNFPDFADLVVPIQPALKINHFYAAFSKRCPDLSRLVDAFNRTLLNMRQEGAVADFIKQYPHQ
jgi:polar amino acid transport system substrate-binding protein